MTKRVLIGVAVVAVLVLVGTIPVFSFCDGRAPGWAENRGGCASWTLLDYAYPWHWGVEEQCLGLCTDSGSP